MPQGGFLQMPQDANWEADLHMLTSPSAVVKLALSLVTGKHLLAEFDHTTPLHVGDLPLVRQGCFCQLAVLLPTEDQLLRFDLPVEERPLHLFVGLWHPVSHGLQLLVLLLLIDHHLLAQMLIGHQLLRWLLDVDPQLVEDS